MNQQVRSVISKFNFAGIIIPVLLVLANFIIKGIYIASNDVAWDEPFSIYIAQLDLSSIIRHLSFGNNPPLYELFLHFWIKLFGISPLSVRFPSLIFSCVTVLFLYRTARHFLNQRVAAYAGLIFIFSDYHIFFAHEARPYALMGMLTVMSMYYYLRLAEAEKPSRSMIAGWLITGILLIYTHYFGFFVLCVQLLHFITSKKLLVKYWKYALMAAGVIILFYAPHLPVLFERIPDASANTWVAPPAGIVSIYNMLWKFSNAPVVTVFVIGILVAALAKFIVTDRKIPVGSAYKLLVIWFVFPFFFMFLVSFWVPMFHDRYLMFVALAFCLLLAVAADYILSGKYTKYIIPVVLVMMFVCTATPDLTNKRNIRDAVEKVRNLQDNNTLVLVCPRFYLLNFAYHYDIDVFKQHCTEDIYKKIDDELQKRNIHGVYNLDAVDYRKRERIVLFDVGGTSYHYNVQGLLKTEYSLKNTFEFYEIFTVYEFISGTGQ